MAGRGGHGGQLEVRRRSGGNFRLQRKTEASLVALGRQSFIADPETFCEGEILIDPHVKFMTVTDTMFDSQGRYRQLQPTPKQRNT